MAASLSAALSAATPLDLLRCQALESPPRGLVLVVGCVGLALGLSDELSGWEGCLKVLKGEPRLSGAAKRARAAAAAAAGVAATAPPGSLWQQLERFDPERVTPAQAKAVLEALAGDVGGLTQPQHLEQINRGGAALGRWLHALRALLKARPPDTADAPSALFLSSATVKCDDAPARGRGVPRARGQPDREPRHRHAMGRDRRDEQAPRRGTAPPAGLGRAALDHLRCEGRAR